MSQATIGDSSVIAKKKKKTKKINEEDNHDIQYQ